jgi:hypothetical protein
MFSCSHRRMIWGPVWIVYLDTNDICMYYLYGAQRMQKRACVNMRVYLCSLCVRACMKFLTHTKTRRREKDLNNKIHCGTLKLKMESCGILPLHEGAPEPYTRPRSRGRSRHPQQNASRARIANWRQDWVTACKLYARHKTEKAHAMWSCHEFSQTHRNMSAMHTHIETTAQVAKARSFLRRFLDVGKVLKNGASYGRARFIQGANVASIAAGNQAEARRLVHCKSMRVVSVYLSVRISGYKTIQPQNSLSSVCVTPTYALLCSSCTQQARDLLLVLHTATAVQSFGQGNCCVELRHTCMTDTRGD